MSEHTTTGVQRKWFDSAHASWCLLGTHLRQIGFFTPLEQRVHLQQQVLKYTSVQKLEMLFVGLLAGMKAISPTATIVRVDPAETSAFGLPGCAEQSVLADTLDAATEADVAAVQEAVADLFAGPRASHRGASAPTLTDEDQEQDEGLAGALMPPAERRAWQIV